jgi:hypothetical protein
MTRIHADELRPGDIIEYGGRLRAVRHVDRRPGWAWPIASDDTGWAMALSHHVVEVIRQAA